MIRDIELENLVLQALDKVCKKTKKNENHYCECVPQIPDGFIPGKDIAVLGRCLDGALEGKTIEVLANDGNNFAKAMKILLTPLYGREWYDHAIYGNIALISDVDGGERLTDRISKTVFNAQYEEICDVYKALQRRYRPRITFLFTGNTASESIFDRIDFNEPIFQIQKTIGFEKIDETIWGYRKDGTPYTINLFKSKDCSNFLELEVPGRGISNTEHASAIIDILKKNKAI